MSAEPVYTPPAPIRDRLYRLAVTEQRLAAREEALEERRRHLEEQEAAITAAQERADQLMHANKKRARVAKERGAELADMNARLLERKRELARHLLEIENTFRRTALPSVFGGREGLYRAEREAQEHERRKKRMARQTGQ